MKKHLVVAGKAIGFVLTWVVLLLFMDPLRSDFLPDNAALSRLLWELMPLVIVLLVTFIFLRVVEKNKIKISFLNDPLKNITLGLALGLIWITGSIAILYLFGSFQLGAKNEIPYLTLWFLAVLFNAAMQEYLVRGYLFSLLRENYNAVLAITVTTILFTVIHIGAFGFGFISVLNVVAMSVFISLLLIYADSLLAPIIVHFVWNGVGRLVFGATSLADYYPNVWDSFLTGNKLLSGGSAKIEGSIVVFSANLILIALMLFLIKKQRRERA